MNIRILGFLIFCFLLTACQNDGNVQLEDTSHRGGRFQHVENPTGNETQQLTNQEIASHLASIASNVPEVNEASALVAGPYAVVAIDVNEDIDRSRVGSIKYTVSEALYHDPWGKSAVVVADGDLMARLRSMGNQIQQGYPIRGVVEELAAIVARYMPEFPVMDDRPQEQDDNEEMLPNDEQREIDQLEKDHSNQN